MAFCNHAIEGRAPGDASEPMQLLQHHLQQVQDIANSREEDHARQLLEYQKQIDDLKGKLAELESTSQYVKDWNQHRHDTLFQKYEIERKRSKALERENKQLRQRMDEFMDSNNTEEWGE